MTIALLCSHVHVDFERENPRQPFPRRQICRGKCRHPRARRQYSLRHTTCVSRSAFRARGGLRESFDLVASCPSPIEAASRGEGHRQGPESLQYDLETMQRNQCANSTRTVPSRRATRPLVAAEKTSSSMARGKERTLLDRGRIPRRTIHGCSRCPRALSPQISGQSFPEALHDSCGKTPLLVVVRSRNIESQIDR